MVFLEKRREDWKVGNAGHASIEKIGSSSYLLSLHLYFIVKDDLVFDKIKLLVLNTNFFGIE